MRSVAVLGLAVALAAGLHGCAGTEPGPYKGGRPSPAIRAAESALFDDDFAAAEAAYTQALKEAGDDIDAAAEAAYWVGVCRRKQDNRDGARAAWTQALATSDARYAALARTRLGDLAWDAGEWRQAREMFTAALKAGGRLTHDEQDFLRVRAAYASARSGDWTAAAELYPPPIGDDRAEDRIVVRHIVSGGQFACVLGPFDGVAAERLVERLNDERRAVESWDDGRVVWVILRPFERWEDAQAEADRWRAQRVSAAALP